MILVVPVFAQEWFDMSTPNVDRRARLVSDDYGRVGYRATVDLINQLSGNRARDHSDAFYRQATTELMTNMAMELFQRIGQTGTYLMVADVQTRMGNERWYYIVCLGWESLYVYAFAHFT